jgi:replication factor A1
MKVERIVNYIHEKLKIPKEKIYEEIKEKIEEFSGIITEEGAATLVAREYGIDIREIAEFLKIDELIGGMRNVNLKVKIFKIFPLKEFEKRDGKGFLRVILIGDKTGVARLTLWNEQVNIIDELNLREGQAIKIYNARTKENIFGDVDILLSPTSSIEIIKDDEELPSLDELASLLRKSYEKVEIRKISAGNYEINGIISNVYKIRTFDICPICKFKVRSVDGRTICEVHQEVQPQKALVFSFELDDFTGSIRVVVFRDLAEKFIKLDEIILLTEEERKKILKERIMGKIVTVRGRVKFNKILSRYEMIANEIEINYG